jgi:hypothetical protein
VEGRLRGSIVGEVAGVIINHTTPRLTGSAFPPALPKEIAKQDQCEHREEPNRASAGQGKHLTSQDFTGEINFLGPRRQLLFFCDGRDPRRQIIGSAPPDPRDMAAQRLWPILRVCPETSRGIAKFSEHEAD